MSERIMKALANCEQGLTEEQKLQARTNIGAIGGVYVHDAGGTNPLTPDSNGYVTIDLTDAGKVQSDWDETNPAEPSYIQNKPDLSIYALKDEIETGVFIGVYTGTEETSTPYADYKSAWEDGKAVFLSYTSGDFNLLLPMEAISDDEIVFTRTVGSVSGNDYGSIVNYLVSVSAEDDAYTFRSSSTGEEQVQSDWTEQDSASKAYIQHKPNLATVATTGDYEDLSNKPTIPAAQVQSDWSQSDNTQVDYIKNKPSLATVATSGSYDDLTDKPSIPAAQVQSDWNEADSSKVDYIKNKPTLSAVATSGDYEDLTNKPTIPAPQVQSDWAQTNTSAVDYIKNKPSIPASQVQSDWTEQDTAAPAYIKNKPTLSAVAESGDYDDLTNKPTIPPAQVQSDWNQTNSQAVDYIKNKPSIPAAQVQSDWSQSNSSAVDYIKNKPNLATVATSGSYNDLSNKPTIPAAQVQSDWNQSNSQAVDYIKNKPTIPAAQVQSDWAQTNTAAADYIKNKPAAMETKPLVAGTNIEFVSQQDRVIVNSSGTKIVKRSNPYSSDVPVTEMVVYDPNEDYGALVRDQNDNTIGYFAPKHYGNTDEGKVLTVVNDNGYKLEWRPQSGGSSDLKLLTEITQNVDGGAGAYQLTIVDGTAYTLNMLVDREVQLITNSTETVHTRIAIHNDGDNVCGGCYLTWRDEALVQHRIYLMLYNMSSNVEYFFDVYIKKVVVNGTPYAIARVTDFPCAYRNGYTDGYASDNINFIGRDY